MTRVEGEVSPRWLPWLGGGWCCAPFSALLPPDGRVIPDSEYCDYESYQLPIREFARAEFRAGRLPLWNPFLGCGMPLHAGQQASLCEPLLTAMGVAFGANFGTKAAMFLHLVLCFAGQYRLGRALGLTRLGGSFAAIVATECAFAVSHLMVGHVTVMAGYALVPWFLLALHRLLVAPGPLTASALGVLGAWMLLAGHPQVPYYALVGGAAWALGSLVAGVAARNRLRVVGWGSVAVLVATLCSLVQVLPTFQLLANGLGSSRRGNEGYAAEFCLDGVDLLRLLFPNLRGNPFIGLASFNPHDAYHERVGYLGLATPLLAVFGLSRAGAARWQWGAAAIAVTAVAVSLGPNTPVFDALGKIMPGLHLFRCPGRVFCLVSPLAGLLAGKGLDALIVHAPGCRARGEAALLTGLWLAAGVAGWAVVEEFDGTECVRWARYAGTVLRLELFALVGIALATVAVLYVCRRFGRAEPRMAGALALGLLLFDLGFNNAGNFHLSPPMAAPELQKLPHVDPQFRVVDVRGTTWPVDKTLRYSRLLPAAFARSWRTVSTNEGGVLPATVERLFSGIASNPQPALAISSCEHVFRRDTSSWEHVPQALPRFRFLPEPLLKTCGIPIETISAREVSKLKECAVTQVDVVYDEAERLAVTLDAPSNGCFVVADTFYPGWRCKLDGREVPIGIAHGVFRRVDVPAGRHRVEFAYDRTPFNLALVGSANGLLLALGLAMAGWARKRANSVETLARLGWPFAIGLLLLEPQVFSGPVPNEPHRILPIGPRVSSGDEPHYLVMLNSLLNDRDLDLANNYAASHGGAMDAGRSFAGMPLEHHTTWYSDDRLIAWAEQFEPAPGDWDRDAIGHPTPKTRKDVPRGRSPEREHSWHPPGLACLLWLPLYPFRQTGLVEPFALFCSGIATVAAMWCFQKLVSAYTPRPTVSWTATAVVFLGTPAWHYGRTLFSEPYLLACATAAYATAFRRQWFLVAGCLIALGVSMKPPFALLLLPLAVGAMLDRRFVSALAVTVPSCVALLTLAALNQQMHGSWSRSPIQWVSGDFLQGASGLTLSWTNGLLPLAPAVLLALASWPTFLRSHAREGVQLAAACLSYFCLMSAWAACHGGVCYGPRLIVPVVPLLCAPLVVAPRCRWWRFLPARTIALGLCVLSIVINGIAAIASGHCWNRNPLDVIASWARFF